MDEMVKAALLKWPNVPACHGWLALDARGRWWLRDAAAQAAGPFVGADPVLRGQMVEHAKLLEFIQRNYAVTEDGCWFFQNGPQRVYVELEAAPWIWRLAADGRLTSHTGLSTSCRSSWLDEHGRLYADSELGFGLVHSLDMHLAADLVEQGRWQPTECPARELPRRFGFVLQPQP